MNESIFEELYIPAGTCLIDPECADKGADASCNRQIMKGCCIRDRISCHNCILGYRNDDKLLEYLEAYNG
jgi:hypothetical protein